VHIVFVEILAVPSFGMETIDSECFVFEVSPPWDIKWFVSQRVYWSFTWNAVAVTEVGCFVHVNPNTVKGESVLVSQIVKHSVPVSVDVLVEEVREVSIATPHSSSQGSRSV
jgi:hypothetical protein